MLETRFVTASGTVVLTDFFVIARAADSRFYDFTALHPTRKLVRTLHLEGAGPVPMQLAVRARPGYGRREAVWEKIEGGFALPETALFTSLRLTIEGGDQEASFELAPGQTHFVVLDSVTSARRPTSARSRASRKSLRPSGGSGIYLGLAQIRGCYVVYNVGRQWETDIFLMQGFRSENLRNC